MSSVRLPVSGLSIALRAPNGADDLFLVEQRERDAQVAAALLARVGSHVDGSPVDWPALSLTDVDAAILELRRLVIGDLVRTATRCTACSSLFDISFLVSDYLLHHVPRKARVTATDEPGWFRLDRTDTIFRLPTPNDVIALASEPEAEAALSARCIRPRPTQAMRRRVERAMQALAPSLYDDLESSCHECGASAPIAFNPIRYVLEELAQRAASIYEEVHLLARCYHWSEHEILALPHQRRARYAELAHAERAR